MYIFIIVHESHHRPVCREFGTSIRRLSTIFFQKCDAGAHNKDKFIRIKIIRRLYSYNEVPEGERECMSGVKSRACN